MVKANLYFLVVIFMRVIGAKGQEMVTQFLNGKMVTDMKVNLSKINEMVSADLFGKTGLFIMVIMKMMRKVAMDGISTSVAISMKDNSSKANKTAMAKFGTTKRTTSGVISTKAIGEIISALATGNTFLQTARNTLASFSIAYSMEKGY